MGIHLHQIELQLQQQVIQLQWVLVEQTQEVTKLELLEQIQFFHV